MNTLKLYPWKNTIIKTIILLVVLGLISYFVNQPVLNNDLAMNQLENSDELFLVWDMYNRIRSALPVVYTVLGIGYIVSIGADVYKFIKRKELESDLT